jgi:hypothetical protein
MALSAQSGDKGFAFVLATRQDAGDTVGRGDSTPVQSL